MRKMKYLRNATAMLLAAVILLCCGVISPSVQTLFAQAEEPAVNPHPHIQMSGEAVSSVTLPENDTILLKAVANNAQVISVGWQILDGRTEDTWYAIANQYSATLNLTYALVGSMLDKAGRTSLRCRMVIDGETVYTDPVEVQVAYMADAPATPTEWTATETQKQRVRMMSARDTEHTTRSIVINYLFDNSSIAFEPYGASVATGSDFSATIKSPTIVGYAPYRLVDGVYVDASEVVLDYTAIQDNVTINVIYRPALVNFSVHHHLQNLLDDEYSLTYDYMTTGQALTGSVVGDGLALSPEALPGFTALSYEKLTVAADGSTVIEIRYDRNYYLVSFDMAGGYGTEPVYTRYGATVGANNPIRHGYVFDGWELVSYGGQTPTAQQMQDYAIDAGTTITVPNANLQYRARWITAETTYTLVFWKENAENDNFSYWGHLDGQSAMSGQRVSAQDRLLEVSTLSAEDRTDYNNGNFIYAPGLSDENVIVEGDGTTVVNVYYTRKYYTLIIKATGKCAIDHTHTHGDSCYDLLCNKEHTHGADCHLVLLCTVAEHAAHTEECLKCGLKEHTVHTDACIVCGKVEHKHSDTCGCSMTAHSHTTSCWKKVNSTSSRPTGAPSNPQQGQLYIRTGTKYIYIGQNWYRYTGNATSSGNNVVIVNPDNCSKTAHAHGDGACDCGYVSHTHGNSCYGDSFHTHSSSCYRDSLHSHSSDCYGYSCLKEEHTHSSACKRLTCEIDLDNHKKANTCTSSSSSNVVQVYRRKYEQALGDIWPITDANGVKYDSGQRWKPSGTDLYSQVLVYLASMPSDDFTLTVDVSSYDPYTMHYCVEALPGQTADRTFEGKGYIVDFSVEASYNYVTKLEDFFDIYGYTQAGSSVKFDSSNKYDNGNKGCDVYFYYDRSTHVLEFNNNGISLDHKAVTDVPFELPLKQYYFEPPYPSNLEPNAYTFAGWYTSPGCYDGSEVNWDTLTMPVGSLMLYAKWVPVTHTLKIYKDATLKEQIGDTQIVDHKAFATAPTDVIQNGNYVFQGWFYTDMVNGQPVEKAFLFNGIPVIEDMVIYAKWGSHISVDYTIEYVLKNTGEPIADPTYGTTIAGNNKTFYAKAGDELFAGFRNGYYPLTNSHTVTMSADGHHHYVFEYVYVESMPYKVQYLDAVTGVKLMDDKYVWDNNLSVVTETFARYEGSMPDAYQKRLILSAGGQDADGDGILDNNVITFYYESDTEHAYYRVVHYVENLEGTGYREYRSEEATGVIGTEYTVTALSLVGFVFDGQLTRINDVVTPVEGESLTVTLGEHGALVELYYKRLPTTYVVKYLDSHTNQPIYPEKNGNGTFGDQILEYAEDLTHLGYDLVGDPMKLFTLTANAAGNVITFYYSESTVSLKYEIVGPAGCGSLTQKAENVDAVNGKPSGSKPMVSNGFIFEGWYLDAACTRPVNEAMVNASTGQLTPTKAAGTIWTTTTYYAKISALETELTIRVNGTHASDTQQAYLFRIVGKAGTDTAKVNLTVSVMEDGETTITALPVGEYTITELTDWSWRYENESSVREVTLVYSAEGTTVEYGNNRPHKLWLDGNAENSREFANP